MALAAVQRLLDDRRIWRARHSSLTSPASLPTGSQALDRALGGGWLRGALTEILTSQPGSSEIALLAPALARLSQKERVLLLSPPLQPYGPGWQQQGLELERLHIVRTPTQHQAWAMEQALRSSSCGAVLAWADRLRDVELRRLQLAAESGNSWGILIRPPEVGASPSAIRLELLNRHSVRIHKCRGSVALSEPVLLAHG